VLKLPLDWPTDYLLVTKMQTAESDKFIHAWMRDERERARERERERERKWRIMKELGVKQMGL
jgi:hypothetical protein